MKKIMTLPQWLIQKTNSEAYRAGRLTGWKHPKVDKALIEALGGKKQLLDQAAALEKDPVIGLSGNFKVTWRDMGSDIVKIDYNLSIIPELCKREGILDTREKQRKDMERIISWREQVLDCEWILPYYDDLIEKLRNGKELADIQDDKLFKCLNAVVKQKEFVWERIFSADVNVLNDSKAFKRDYKSRIFTILKAYSPHYVDGMDIDELFAMHEIHSYSQTLEWKGGLQYLVDDKVHVDTSCNRYGTVLNTQTIEHSVPYKLSKCKKVMTIENKANYENMVYEDDTLYIYCHGYFAPKEVKFLKGIQEIVDSECEFYHWGDMDFGGISIFQFIKDKVFPELKPYKMGEADFMEAIRCGAGIALDESTRAKLEKKDAGMLDGLKQKILETGMTIEQEKCLVSRNLF